MAQHIEFLDIGNESPQVFVRHCVTRLPQSLPAAPYS
jgi:hypothetical protein